MDVNDAAELLCQLYHEFNAAIIVVEANNGGDWIPSLISKYDQTKHIQDLIHE